MIRWRAAMDKGRNMKKARRWGEKQVSAKEDKLSRHRER